MRPESDVRSPIRDPLSLLVMFLPLIVIVGAGVLFRGELDGTFEVFLDTESGEVNTAPALTMYLVALVPSVAAAWVGWLGRTPEWQVNRRFQRALLGSVAAAGCSVFLGTLSLTLSRAAGDTPDYGAAMFGTLCALTYGGICAAITPPDHIDPVADEWHPEPRENQRHPDIT